MKSDPKRAKSNPPELSLCVSGAEFREEDAGNDENLRSLQRR
jgi:hypothetical protein